MPLMVEKNTKGNYERHGHRKEGPANPCCIMVGDEAEFWDAVEGYRDYDRYDSDHRDSKWEA